MSESKSKINTHLSFLQQQAEDHAARSRQLYDSFVKYVYSLNAGGIAVVMGIAAATIKRVDPGEFILSLILFSLGLIFVTVSVYLTWRISKLYAIEAMDLRDKASSKVISEEKQPEGDLEEVETWFNFVSKHGHQDRRQLALVILSFVSFFAGLVFATINLVEIPTIQ